MTTVELDRPSATYEVVMTSKARMIPSANDDRYEYPRPSKYWRLMFWRESEWEPLGDGIYRAEFELESILYV